MPARRNRGIAGAPGRSGPRTGVGPGPGQTAAGMLPICTWCKKVRNDQNYWLQVEEYICRHADVTFSHGICPTCMVRELARPPAPEAD